MYILVLLLTTCALWLHATGLQPTAALAAAAAPVAPPTRLFLPQVSHNTPATPFGVQMYGRPSDAAQKAAEAAAAGVSWVRIPISWAEIEPVNTTPATFNFSNLDATVRGASELHLRLILTIGDNPAWAATYTNGHIDRAPLTEFAQFVGALVERYNGDGFADAPGSPAVKVWEFYNEPDFGDVMGAEAPFNYSYWGDFGQEYAAMLCAARAAAKAADPGAQIAIGGLAYDWFRDDKNGPGPFVRTFLDDVLKNGGGQCMDLMNFHYYPFFEAKWSAYGSGVAGKANYLRSVLAGYGLADKPFIITEAGHHSNDYSSYPSTPAEQANYVVKLFTQSLAARVKVMIWWTWMDLPGYWGETGLLTAQGSQKPAYSAYGVAASKLGRAQFVRDVPPSETGSDTARVYAFTGTKNFYVAWADGTTAASIALPGHTFALIDPMGTVRGYATDSSDGRSDGLVHIAIGSEPRYVEQVD